MGRFNNNMALAPVNTAELLAEIVARAREHEGNSRSDGGDENGERKVTRKLQLELMDIITEIEEVRKHTCAFDVDGDCIHCTRSITPEPVLFDHRSPILT